MLNDICPSLKLQPITPALLKDEVLNHLQACRIFHFAGHGQSDPMEPSRSCLLLQDWKTNPLTVGDLRDRRLQENPPFLAYLSACSTGANDTAELADEGIHLVSPFQLAGFRHVIGTLWEVSDMHCVDVARVFYETLRDEGMTDAAVCRGLHRTIRALRASTSTSQEGDLTREADVNYVVQEATGTGDDNDEIAENDHEGQGMFWVPYIHFGV
ncbi:CHAT domain-containing protein [Staphylotrichum tortipilum]|uniref:CHAT domain-containing protein n=1 Tax=Staphylotrichum tortipilum TaxID=2831512 RepID=A0AAN6MAK5_9PEZI|nr:CHAT domain-containing protein [Staphylotrichum longicolle]